MKSLLSLLLTGGVIALLSGATINAADEKPVAQEPQFAQSGSTARSIPFRGTVDKVDLETKSIMVGKRVFYLTETTKILRGNDPVKLEDAKVGDKVGGAYRKEADDKLVAVTVRFGDKPSSEPAPKKQQEDKESE